MKVREMVEREIEAWKRDREFDKNDTFTIDEVLEYLNQYPSLKRRAEKIEYGIRHVVEKVLEVPDDIHNFVHRGRHGWGPYDAVDMTEKLPLQLAGMLRYFKEHAYSVPHEFLPEEFFDENGNTNYEYDGPIGDLWDAKLEDLAERFEKYPRELKEHYELFFDTIEEDNENYNRIHRELEETFAEFAKIVRHLSW